MNLENLTKTLHLAVLSDDSGEELQMSVDTLFRGYSDEFQANLYATIWDSNRTYGSILSILSRSLSNV